jgi:hypothetical protein
MENYERRRKGFLCKYSLLFKNIYYEYLNSLFNKHVTKFRRIVSDLNNPESLKNFTKQGIITKNIALCTTFQ